MKLAYVLTQYPKVSHTFIRREILGMERRGHEVLRFSTNKNDANVVDADDLEELGKTLQFYDASWPQVASNVIRTIAGRPGGFFAALFGCLRLCVRSEISALRELFYFFQATYISTVFDSSDIEHIHAHFGTGGSAVARWSSKITGIPFSFTVHAHDMFDAPKARDVYGKVRDSRFVVGVCSYTISQIYRWSAVEDWEKIHKVRCFPGAEYLTSAKEIAPPCDSFVCVARLDPEKGHIILLKAFQQLRSSGREAKLILIGDGRFRTTIEDFVAQNSMHGYVELTGNLDAEGVRRHLRGARALVLPSFMEGLPVVIMEAFAQRRPVISTYIAGIPELVRPNENGWIVPAGDVQSLSIALSDAFDAPVSQIQKMGDVGRVAIEQNHDEDSEIDHLDRLLQRH